MAPTSPIDANTMQQALLAQMPPPLPQPSAAVPPADSMAAPASQPQMGAPDNTQPAGISGINALIQAAQQPRMTPSNVVSGLASQLNPQARPPQGRAIAFESFLRNFIKALGARLEQARGIGSSANGFAPPDQ